MLKKHINRRTASTENNTAVIETPMLKSIASMGTTPKKTKNPQHKANILLLD